MFAQHRNMFFFLPPHPAPAVVEPNTLAKTKRAQRLLEPDNIAKAMSFQCSCVPQCAMRWTRQNLYNSRYSFFNGSFPDQMRRVYDILLAHYDHLSSKISLTIGGKVFKYWELIHYFREKNMSCRLSHLPWDLPLSILHSSSPCCE